MLEMLTERISYLRGLADGLDVSEKSAEGKLLVEIVGILDDMQNEFRELHMRIEETEDYVEAIDEDLEDVELILFDNEEELYETVTDCEGSEDDEYVTYYDLDDDEDARVYESVDDEDHLETTYEFACPSCQEMIFLHEGVDEDGYYHFVIEPYHAGSDIEAINPT
ncbi:CD1247 N-terminal domain-containing protein [Brevibacillus nitrificans]|uniref:CD1247 N-terminal domain-containing protein n=1 Tax=Brevibacillus nitrificans TaxID=651560 RepID=UPI002862B0F4|nr:CD1247 N-terminal domain-containing protein [Brevibacillus nitrificans]MDR7314117.1 hypothetical protein [Brevibacillus nitrificans]